MKIFSPGQHDLYKVEEQKVRVNDNEFVGEEIRDSIELGYLGKGKNEFRRYNF